MRQPTPILKVEYVRREVVTALRRVAQQLERAPRNEAAEMIVPIMSPLGEIERWVRRVLRQSERPRRRGG